MIGKLDHFLAKLPQSDNSWGCPWFIVICFFALCALLFGFAADGGVGAGVGIAGGAFIIALMTTREPGDCKP